MATRELAVASTGSPPDVEDVRSVGTRISWGAIVAGCVLALALLFLLTVLGSAVGVSVSDRVEPANLRLGAVLWAIVTTCAALFVGGMVVSQFTVGENKWEAVVYGIIMWALLIALLLGLSAAGVRAGFNTLVAMAGIADGTAPADWEASARRAGVPVDQIQEWRKRLEDRAERPAHDAGSEARQTDPQAVRRVTWYAFGGIWVSMLAAAAGTLVGAGPTFRLVVRPRPEVRVQV